MIVAVCAVNFACIKQLGTSKGFLNEGKEKTEILEWRGMKIPIRWGVKMKKPSIGEGGGYPWIFSETRLLSGKLG